MNSRNLLLALAAIFTSPTALALSCGDILYSNTTLSADLYCTSGWTALEIAQDGVVLDLNGHTISGTVLNGVFLYGVDNVTIRGPGKITGVGLGVQAVATAGLTVSNIDFQGSDLALTGAENALVEDNRFSNIVGVGIAIIGFDDGTVSLPSTGNELVGNTFYKVTSGSAVQVCGYNATDTSIHHNKFKYLSEGYGIHLEVGTHDNSIFKNEFFSLKDATAIVLRNANDNTLEANTLKYGDVGIAIHNNNGITFPGCAQPPQTVVVSGNVIRYNTIQGFDLAVSLGLGIMSCPTSAIILNNKINANDLLSNGIGIRFREDAWHNDGTGNNYTGTSTPVIDVGTGNVY